LDLFLNNDKNIIYGVNNYPFYDFCELIFCLIKQEFYKSFLNSIKDFLNFLENEKNLINSKTQTLKNLVRHYIKKILEDINDLENNEYLKENFVENGSRTSIKFLS